MNIEKLYEYRIFPPYIDSYLCNYDVEGKRSLKEIKKMMIGHADNWGEQSIGRAVLKNGNPLMLGEKYIVCCAYVRDGKERREYQVLFSGTEMWDEKNYEIIEADIDSDWDVT